MAGTDSNWHAKAMTWPLLCGAAAGSALAWQFAASDLTSRLSAIIVGSLCSLPAGIAFGLVAILAGRSVLSFMPESRAGNETITWRLAFGSVTGVTTGIVAALALAVIGGPSAPAVTVGTIAFTAACIYFPAPDPPST
ncbi:hypothetical protein ABH922_002746 [Rhodococcus sp. 27YEA15]|uniref:hypothetical protein n=1 Tax=Rhodococcus sp. 27YEA15 TaxID=3156259 RepID=UPI003C7A7FA1